MKIKIIRAMLSRINQLLLQYKLENRFKLGYKASIHHGSMGDIDYLSLGDYSQFAKKGSNLQGHIEIGRHTYSAKIRISAKYTKVKIGSYCSFGDNIVIFSGFTFHSPERVSTYPFGNIDKFSDNKWIGDLNNKEFSPLIIGNDVWVGENVKILKSVSYIGHGAVIGAGGQS